MSEKNNLRIIIVGVPASGKTTAAAYISKALKMVGVNVTINNEDSKLTENERAGRAPIVLPNKDVIIDMVQANRGVDASHFVAEMQTNHLALTKLQEYADEKNISLDAALNGLSVHFEMDGGINSADQILFAINRQRGSEDLEYHGADADDATDPRRKVRDTRPLEDIIDPLNIDLDEAVRMEYNENYEETKHITEEHNSDYKNYLNRKRD